MDNWNREVIWYHFTAVKWFHITSQLSILVTVLSHWYPHIICSKMLYVMNIAMQRTAHYQPRWLASPEVKWRQVKYLFISERLWRIKLVSYSSNAMVLVRSISNTYYYHCLALLRILRAKMNYSPLKYQWKLRIKQSNDYAANQNREAVSVFVAVFLER